MARGYIGGTFAPPIDAKKLKEYADLIGSCQDPQIKDSMTILHKMLVKFRETPASTKAGKPHPATVGRKDTSGKSLPPVQIVQLEDDEIQRIWDHVPDEDELEMFGKRFDKIDPVHQRDLRNAAFHLLWFGRELFLDREPLTADLL